LPHPLAMPSTSTDMTAGKLARWLVNEGDTIAAGDILAEIETDKATIEFEAPAAGVVARILVAAGSEDVEVGRTIAILAVEGESVSAIAESSPPTPIAVAPAAANGADAAGSTAAVDALPSAVEASSSERIFASPVARAIARQNGVDLRTIGGTRPRQRIVKADVERHLRTLQSASRPSPATIAISVRPESRSADKPMPWQTYRATPNSSMRQTIARRVLASKQSVPHFYLTASIELDQLLAARGRLNVRPGVTNKLTVNDFFIKASAFALRQVPEANAMWSDDALLRFDDVDVSIAVATDAGLFTPVIRRADQKGLEAISAEMKELAARARANKLKPEEYQGGGFSISNLGMHGVEQFAAIINPPQSCILALGAGNKRTVVRDDAIVVRTLLTATLSVDHRSVDGAVGARLLAAIKAAIEEPISMVL
jgi:pyruvate dehydrogenase E2 component (dihydrolipoamide acetyltransferase)